MLKILYKNQDNVTAVAFINPDHIVYVSGNANGNTYVRLTGDGFLFAMEPIAEVLAQLEKLYA